MPALISKSLVFNFAKLLCTVTLLFLFACTNKEKTAGEIVVVQVGDEKLTAQDFASQITRHAKLMDAIIIKEPKSILRIKNEIINAFVVQSLVKLWAKENNIQVSNAEVETEVSLRKSQYPNITAFQAALTKENKKYSDWILEIKSTLLEKRLFNSFKSQYSEPSEKDMLSYYNSNKDHFKRTKAVRITQIVLDREESAKHIIKELKAGKSFTHLAKKYSIAPEGKNGGDTGWLDIGILDLYDQAFNMRIGVVSGVLKSPYGFHIMKLTDKRSAGPQPFKEVKAKIEKLLLEGREQATYSKWLESQIRHHRVFKDEKVINAIKVYTEGK